MNIQCDSASSVDYANKVTAQYNYDLTIGQNSQSLGSWGGSAPGISHRTCCRLSCKWQLFCPSDSPLPGIFCSVKQFSRECQLALLNFPLTPFLPSYLVTIRELGSQGTLLPWRPERRMGRYRMAQLT